MHKRDHVFWIATGIFFTSIALFASTGNQLWLFFMVASYLLRPTLTSLKFRCAIDERQMIINYRSGNIAYGVMNTAALLFAFGFALQGGTKFLAFIAVVAAGLIARILFVMVVSNGFRGNLLENLWFSLHAALTYNRKKLDEWQLSIHYRSGNFAFATDMLAAITAAVIFAVNNDHTFEAFNGVVIIGLATKAMFNVLLLKNYREAASKIIIAVGLMMALFESLEGIGLRNLIGVLPGLTIAGIGWLSSKYPKTIGVLVFLLTAGLFFVLVLRKGFSWGQFETALLICVPFAVAGGCLFLPERKNENLELDQ